MEKSCSLNVLDRLAKLLVGSRSIPCRTCNPTGEIGLVIGMKIDRDCCTVLLLN